MKSIALIHSVETVATEFPRKLKEFLDTDIKLYNIWDDFLAINPNEIGQFSIENKNRLFNDIKAAEMTGADFIVVTCSTLTPTVELIRPFIKVPVIAIDDRMVELAVSVCDKLLIFATAISTKEPLTKKVKALAKAIDKNIEVDFISDSKAFEAMKRTDMKEHDEIVLKLSEQIKGYDGIILAQASMAHLQEKIEEITKIKVYSGPQICLQQIKDLLKE